MAMHRSSFHKAETSRKAASGSEAECTIQEIVTHSHPRLGASSRTDSPMLMPSVIEPLPNLMKLPPSQCLGAFFSPRADVCDGGLLLQIYGVLTHKKVFSEEFRFRFSVHHLL
jgi:hypothetical protein